VPILTRMKHSPRPSRNFQTNSSQLNGGHKPDALLIANSLVFSGLASPVNVDSRCATPRVGAQAVALFVPRDTFFHMPPSQHQSRALSPLNRALGLSPMGTIANVRKKAWLKQNSYFGFHPHLRTAHGIRVAPSVANGTYSQASRGLRQRVLEAVFVATAVQRAEVSQVQL